MHNSKQDKAMVNLHVLEGWSVFEVMSCGFTKTRPTLCRNPPSICCWTSDKRYLNYTEQKFYLWSLVHTYIVIQNIQYNYIHVTYNYYQSTMEIHFNQPLSIRNRIQHSTPVNLLSHLHYKTMWYITTNKGLLKGYLKRHVTFIVSLK